MSGKRRFTSTSSNHCLCDGCVTHEEGGGGREARAPARRECIAAWEAVRADGSEGREVSYTDKKGMLRLGIGSVKTEV